VRLKERGGCCIWYQIVSAISADFQTEYHGIFWRILRRFPMHRIFSERPKSIATHQLVF